MIRRRNVGRNHWYLDDDGNRVPGVTTILKALPKPALINWAAEVTADYYLDNRAELDAMPPSQAWKALKNARNTVNAEARVKGTKVHNLADKVGRGLEVSVPDELQPYVDAYVKFLDDFSVEIIHSETVVWSEEHGYCGTLDTIAVLVIGGRRFVWLLDTKTGKGVYGEVGLQEAAYRHADWLVSDEKSSGGLVAMPTVDATGVVHLKADGTYELIQVQADLPEFADFLTCKAQHEAIERTKHLVLGPVTPDTEDL